jgi:putative hydrolase of the HAD superfamily
VSPSHLIFDVDNTLYPRTRGVVQRVDARINLFMKERLGLDADTVDVLRERYRREHGTTLHGLMLHHQIEPDDYLEAVHAIELDDVLEPDRPLQEMLARLPHRKLVFTNGSAAHAERVLARLGVRSYFTEIFSLERVAYVPKPRADGFRAVLAAIAAAAEACVFIDDDPKNVRTARALGMRTVLVGDSADGDGAADVVVPSVLHLAGALSHPRLRGA